MTNRLLLITPVLAAGAAGAIALGPIASATPSNCTSNPRSTVCQGPGSSSVVVNPPNVGGSANQNGSYGPGGNVPPLA